MTAVKNKRKPKKVTPIPLKTQNYYGVFNHMIEDNIAYIKEDNSLKSKIVGWVIYALIITLLIYISFNY